MCKFYKEGRFRVFLCFFGYVFFFFFFFFSDSAFAVFFAFPKHPNLIGALAQIGQILGLQ